MDMVARLPLGGRRWQRYGKTLRFAGVDLTGADMRLQIRLYRNAPGTPVIDLSTVTNGNAEGLRLIGVEQVNGKPVSTVALVINETTMESTPFMGEAGDDSMFAYDMQVTPAGGYKQVWLEGEFWVLAAVTGAENATPGSTSGYSTSRPTRPSLAAGSSEFQIGDSVIQVEIAAPSGPKGDSAVPSQRYDFTAVAGQSRVPANGALIDNDGKPFSYGLNFATLIVNNKTIAPELYSYGGGDKPVALAGGFVFTAGDKVTVIGQPYNAFETIGAGDNEGVPLHEYEGTSISADPFRLDHNNKQLENALKDTRDPTSPNFGKYVDIYPGKGAGVPHPDEMGGAIDKVTGLKVPARFVAQNNDTLIDDNTQNGRPVIVGNTVVVLPAKDHAGNLLSGSRIRLRPGARVRRPPRDYRVILPLILGCDPVASEATTNASGVDTQSDVFLHLEIVCVGDAVFFSENHRWGYREHHNDLSLNAASDFNIKTRHLGNMSDALYLGASNNGPDPVALKGLYNRHNKRGILDIYADGYNQNNRNVVSVIDCVGLSGTVRGYNYSRAGGAGNNSFNPNSGTLAPGIVDIEPNAFTDDPRIDDIELHVYAEDSGASAVATLLIDNNLLPNPLGAMRFTGRAVRCKHGKHTLIGAVDMRTPYQIHVRMDAIDCESPFEVLSGQGCTHEGGRNLRSTRSGLIGYSNFAAPQDFWRRNEIDQELGSLDTAAIQVRGWNGGGIDGGQMINGNNKGYHLLSNTGFSPIRDLIIGPYTFVSRPGITSQTMVFPWFVDPSNGGPQLFSSSITERNINYNGLKSSMWAVSGSYVTSIPGAGLWTIGQEVFGDPTLEPGSPRIMRTRRTNTSGAPSFFIQEQVGGFTPDTGGLSALQSLLRMTSANGRYTGFDPMAVALGTAQGFEGFDFRGKAPFSGSQSVYVGLTKKTNVATMTPADIALGIWFGDTTGGQVGQARAIVGGGASGAPFPFKYNDDWTLIRIGTGAGAVQYRAEGNTGNFTQVTSTGMSGTYYLVIIINVAGETILINRANAA